MYHFFAPLNPNFISLQKLLFVMVAIMLFVSCQTKRQEPGQDVSYEVRDYRTVKLMLDTLNAKLQAEADSTGTFTVPYTDLSKGAKRLIFMGTSHTRDVHHPQFAVMQKVFYEMRPQIAFNEGGQIAKGTTYVSIDSAILKNGETGVLKYLSDSIGIVMNDGDLDSKLEFSMLLERLPKDQVYLYMAIERFLNGYKDGHFGSVPLEEAFENKFIGYLDEFGFPLTAEERTLGYMKSLYRKYFNEEFSIDAILPVHEYYLLDDGPFGDIGRMTKIVRDEALLKNIDSALYKYDRVFVVFGNSHRLAVEPALKQIMKKH